MYSQNKKVNKFKKPILTQVLFAVVGLILVGVISLPLARNVSKQYNINKEIKELEEEISGLKGKNEDFKNLIEYLDSDEFIEEQARLNLNYMKSGEQLVVVKEGEQTVEPSYEVSDSESATYGVLKLADQKSEERESNFYNWYSYFFIKFL